MAEDQIADTEVPEDVVAEQEPTPTPPRTVEDFARERGWKPKQEFGGDETDWRDAETFIAFGLDKTRDLTRDVKALRETTDRMSRTQAQITEQAVDRARAEERRRWEETHTRAVEEGDLGAATQAVQKIAELAQPAPRDPATDPTVESFRRENAWFDADPAAQAVAIATAGAVAKRQGSVAEQLKAAQEAVHKRFPEYAPTPAKAPASVAAPASRASPTGGRKKGFSDLPAQAQAVARQLKDKGLVQSVDSYAEQYFSVNKGAAA